MFTVSDLYRLAPSPPLGVWLCLGLLLAAFAAACFFCMDSGKGAKK